MKYKLLGISTESMINIGDYIQGLASAQFLPTIDGFVQREELNRYDDDETKIIMNGWFMHNPDNWPPSEKINPFFISFHINVLAQNKLLENNSINYIKKYEPIGCRDFNTVNLLKSKGVNAYFSGCMTLTLGYKYKNVLKEDKIYFVDPFFKTNWNVLTILKNIIFLLFNHKEINIISKKYPEKKSNFRKKMILATFYREYIKIFTKETIINAEYINQQSTEIKDPNKTETAYLKEAEQLIEKYAKAKLIVTSRIHCALPCLGLETPVIYIEDTNQSEASRCRLDGIKELFNIIKWENGKLIPEFNINGKISINNRPHNKNAWKSLAEELIIKCENFIKNT